MTILSNEFDPDEGVDVQTIEVAGLGAEVLDDGFGRVWNIPAENLDDNTDLANTIFDEIIKKLDPRFHYQLVGAKDWGKYKLQDFAIVSKKELGLGNDLVIEYGKTLTDDFAVGDAILVKIPKVLAMRRIKRRQDLIEQYKNLTEPNPDMLTRAARSGTPVMKSLQELRDSAKGVRGGSLERTINSHISEKLTQ